MQTRHAVRLMPAIGSGTRQASASWLTLVAPPSTYSRAGELVVSITATTVVSAAADKSHSRIVRYRETSLAMTCTGATARGVPDDASDPIAQVSPVLQ